MKTPASLVQYQDPLISCFRSELLHKVLYLASVSLLSPAYKSKKLISVLLSHLRLSNIS